MGKLLYGTRYVEDDEDELEAWKNAVKNTNNYDQLHGAMINWSVILGKLALDDYPGRAAIGRRMEFIGDRMDELQPRETKSTDEPIPGT